MTTLTIDIDHFKTISETHGHIAGDYAVKHVADITRRAIRTTGKVARFDGGEF
ncbi:conserved protein of unknown function [Bradyrhizobium sp. ORS 285]|uniref:diguanylate cyclase n=1 Tax=Bradyrhizobium sp. ORS 285 TaxID=115808 RepID=UPI0002407E5B|nr:diguanylate cyclase [Bradyrhizobium sp. ORS 285]CCD86197.1 conserved hypothetical protein [Bradyrhizobium sp. ORS 285]SMX61035.1 conserved protein of unknown function [Bradyrhizobium sp. ORS 285]